MIENSFVELGAQWVHGEEGNPLYELASERQLLSDPKKDYGTEGEGHFCTDDGDIIDNQLVDDAIMAMDRIKEDLADGHYDILQTSCDDVFRKYFQKYVDSKCTSINPVLLWALYDWFMVFENIDNACDSLSKLSPKAYSEWFDCPSIPLVNFSKSYQSLLDSFLDEIPLNCIKLNSPIVQVDYGN